MYSRIQLPNYNYECVNDPCNEHKNLPYRTFPSFQRVLSRPLTGTILHRQPLIWFLLPEFCLFYFFNRYRAILLFSCVSFFLCQFLCGVLFQEIFPIHLRCWIYWHNVKHNIPYYSINIYMFCGEVPFSFLILVICVGYFFSLISIARGLKMLLIFQRTNFWLSSFSLFSILFVSALKYFLSATHLGFNWFFPPHPPPSF